MRKGTPIEVARSRGVTASDSNRGERRVKDYESADARFPEAGQSKSMLVNVTAEPVSGVKAWP